MTAQWATALEALQLSLKLLPPACRDELCTLLTFMVLAADPQEVKLDKEVKSLSENQCDLHQDGFHSVLRSGECVMTRLRQPVANLLFLLN